ncbi:MAG: hypothetical protein JHD38_18500 [Mycolicibacterium sp.]|nr:hypothetical protein [Mycolicibacterium sp.]
MACSPRRIDIPQAGDIGGVMRFAYLDCAFAGVPCIELAEISPDMRALFDSIKQQSRAGHAEG